MWCYLIVFFLNVTCFLKIVKVLNYAGKYRYLTINTTRVVKYIFCKLAYVTIAGFINFNESLIFFLDKNLYSSEYLSISANRNKNCLVIHNIINYTYQGYN